MKSIFISITMAFFSVVFFITSSLAAVQEYSGIIYYPDSGVTNHGAVSGKSLATYSAMLTARNAPATIKLTHSGSGTSTAYSVTSSVTVPSLATLTIEKGAKLNIAAGVTVLVKGGIDAGHYGIVTGAGCLEIHNGQEIDVIWYTSNGDGQSSTTPYQGRDGKGGLGEAISQCAYTDGASSDSMAMVFKLQPGFYDLTDEIQIKQYFVSIYCDGSGTKRQAYFNWNASGTSVACIDFTRDDPTSLTESQITDTSLQGVYINATDTTTHNQWGIRLADVRECVISDCGVNFQSEVTGSIGLRIQGRDDIKIDNCNFFAQVPIKFCENVSTAVSYDCDMTSLRDLYLVSRDDESGTTHYCVEFEGPSNDSEFYNITFDGFQTMNDGDGAIRMIKGEFRNVNFNNVRYEDHVENTPHGYFFLIEDTDTSRDISINKCMTGGTVGPHFVRLDSSVLNFSLSDCAYYGNQGGDVFLDINQDTYPIVLSNVFSYSSSTINKTGLAQAFSLGQTSPAGAGSNGKSLSVYLPSNYSANAGNSVRLYDVSTWKTYDSAMEDSGVTSSPASGSTIALPYYGDAGTNRAMVVTVWTTRDAGTGYEIYGQLLITGVPANVDREILVGDTAELSVTNVAGKLCVYGYDASEANQVIQNNTGRSLYIVVSVDFL